MNKKLIAVAVASAVAAPVASADVTVYGRINNAIEIVDSGSSNTTDVSGISSRFGFKASSDLGNGMTASARYEFATTTDKEQSNIADMRIGTVGLSGGFGSVTIGNQWSAFFNTAGTDLDATYALGYILYSSVVGAPYRGSNTIKYSNTFGPVYMEADFRLNESGEGNDVAEKINGDGMGIGFRISASEQLTIGVAYDTEDGSDGAADTKRTALTARYKTGSGLYALVGFNKKEEGSADAEQTQVWIGHNMGSTRIQFGYGTADVSTSTGSPSQMTLGIYHSLGGGLKLWYEGADVDGDGARSDMTAHIFGMRYDF